MPLLLPVMSRVKQYKYRTYFIFFEISYMFTFGPSSKCGRLMSQPLSQQIFCNLGSYCSFDKSGLVSSATSFLHVQDCRNLVPKLVSYVKSDHIVFNSFLYQFLTFSFFIASYLIKNLIALLDKISVNFDIKIQCKKYLQLISVLTPTIST